MTTPSPSPSPATSIRVDDVHRYIQQVKNCIEHCIQNYMNEEQTITYLCRASRIPPFITSTVWRWLRESNPEFFNEYSLRLQLLRQIRTFNVLLNKQAQFLSLINNPQPPRRLYNPGQYYWQPPVSQFDQKFPSSGDGHLTKFPDMAVPNMSIVLPQDTSPSCPFCPVIGPSRTGNNVNALPNRVVSVPNSYLPYGFPNGSSFMHQDYPPVFLSSTLPVNGNMPQLPTIHDSSRLPSLRNHIGGPYTSLLQAHASSNTHVLSPMNTEDENGTVTQLGIGGLTMDGSPPSV